jgi:ketosteroid isomerase-like protein
MTGPNKQIVANAWKVFASRDVAAIGRCFTEDAEWIAPEGNATAIALGGPHHMIGREAIARFIGEDFGRLFVADVDIAFTAMLADGDQVVVEERMRATLVNGRQYDNSYCFIFTVRDGAIAQVREYMDTAKGKRQIFGDGVPGQIA